MISVSTTHGNMADNYLEKKMEEFKAIPTTGMASKNSRKPATTLSKLVAANKFYKSFNNSIIVRESHLKELINIATSQESSANCDDSLQMYFYPTVNNSEVSVILDCLKNQNQALFNFENQEQLPKSFIIIGAVVACDEIYFNLGTITNTILLRATEMGLNGSYTLLSGQNNLQDSLKLQFTPLAAIAIGKGI